MRRSIGNKIKMGLESVFMGLKGGDDVIKAPSPSLSEGTNVVAPVSVDSVWNDLLRAEETQRVKELRDRYYRIYKESNKYSLKLKTSTITSENDYEQIFNDDDRKLVKVDKVNVAHPNIDESDGLPIVVIQDSQSFGNEEDIEVTPDKKVKGKVNVSVKTDLDEIIFKFSREGFIPRMLIEPYVKRVAVKKIDEEHSRVDIYIPIYTRQFFKKDSLIKNEIEKIKKGAKSDLFDFSRFSFITYKAWGASDISLFDFEDMKFNGVHEYDGHYIASFDCKNISVNVDLTEKFKLEEVDKKYEEMAPNEHQDGSAPDINALMRKIEKG